MKVAVTLLLCHKFSSAMELHTSCTLASADTIGYENIQNNQQTNIALRLAKRTSRLLVLE